MIRTTNGNRLLQAILLNLACACAMPGAYADSFLTEGIAHYNKREYKQAIQSLDKSIAANPRVPTAFYYEALSLSQLGDSVKAKQFYSNVCTNFPTSAEARFAATYLQRVDSQFANVLSPTTRITRSAAGAASQPMGDMTSFEAANATSDDLSKLPDQASVPFSHGPDGHLFVNTQINGRTVQMMFDTGASVCLIGKNQLEAAGVTDSVIKGQHSSMGGVGSTVNTAAPMIVDLRVGGIQRHMPIMVQDKFALSPLLGQTFYNGYQYDIDNQSGVIRFTKKSLARSNQGYDSIEIPFQTAGNNMVVTAEINGHACQMFFDTGAGMNLFDLRTFQRMGLSVPSDAQMMMVGGVGGSTLGYTFQVNQMRLGGIQKNNIPVCVVTSGGPPLPLLGQPFLKDRRFTIDNDRKVIRFAR